LRRHPDAIRYALLAAFCWQRRHELLDTLIDLLLLISSFLACWASLLVLVNSYLLHFIIAIVRISRNYYFLSFDCKTSLGERKNFIMETLALIFAFISEAWGLIVKVALVILAIVVSWAS